MTIYAGYGKFKMRDYCENTFTETEMRMVAGRWMFWKGLFIGAIGMLISIFSLGLFLNY